MLMSVHRIVLFLLLCSTLFLSSCRQDPPTPDVSDIEVEFDIVRYDSLFFEMDTANLESDYQELKSDHSAFTELYVKQILRLKDTLPQIDRLLQSQMLRALYDSVKLHYEDMRDIRAEFKSAFQFYAYYFPQYEVPDIYTCLTEFSLASFLFLDENEEDALGVSLDMYLGDEFPYARLGKGTPTFSNYLIRTFNKDHLVKKTMQALVQDKTGSPPDSRLIDYMVHNGKQLYILNRLMPDIPDTVLFEYTLAQLEWCENNEAEIWSFFIDKELLYSRERSEINTLISPAPSSMGMPPESPGRTANYIGYKIVESYVNRHDVELFSLINEKDAQKILTESRYRAR